MTRRYRGSLLVALPYPYRGLHQGRIGGTFLPADIMRRYLRMCKVPVALVSGVDSYGTAVWLESKALNIAPQDYVRAKQREYLRDLKTLWITPTKFMNTNTRSHGRFVRRYMRGLGSRVQTRVCETRYCEGCNLQTNQRLLMDPDTGLNLEKMLESGIHPSAQLVCTVCGLKPTVKPLGHSWLVYKPQDLRVSQDHFHVRDLVQTCKNITRYIPWGVATGVSNQVYYVWVEALLSYGQRGCRPYRFFYGKDNRYYHAVILRQLRVPGSPLSRNDNTYCRNYILSKGQKISTSKGGLSLPQGDPLVKRLALVIADPRTQDMDYGPDQLQSARKIIRNKFLNLWRRVQGWYRARGVGSVVLGDLDTGSIERDYRNSMLCSKPARALQCCLAYHYMITKKLQSQIREGRTESSLKFHLRRLDLLLQPLIPQWRNERTRYDP